MSITTYIDKKVFLAFVRRELNEVRTWEPFTPNTRSQSPIFRTFHFLRMPSIGFVSIQVIYY